MLTRSRAVIELVSIQVNVAVDCQSRATLEKLALLLLEVTWSNQLHDLADSDVAGLSWMDGGYAEGRKQVTWIWKVHGSISEEGMDKHSREGTFIYSQLITTKQMTFPTYSSLCRMV